MGKATRIFTDVDYEKDGKQIGWLYLPYSVTRSAYGNVAIPVAVIKRDYFVLAPAAGLFEPLVALGATVEAGEACGQVHFVDDPGRAPVVARFRASGSVISQRHFGRVERGDCVAHLATDWRG